MIGRVWRRTWAPGWLVLNVAWMSGGAAVYAQPVDSIATRRLNAIRYADQFPGADAGARIAAALDDLPPEGGVVDARGFTGEQSITTALRIGAPGGKATSLLLGPAVFRTTRTLTVYTNSSIVGVPIGSMGGAVTGTNSLIEAADGARLSAVIQLGDGTSEGHGSQSVLQDLVVDGNKDADGTADGASAAILVNLSQRIELFRVTAQNSKGHGIVFISGDSPPFAGESCCAKLAKVMSVYNRLDGLFAYFSEDLFVVQSEFEGNGAAGVELDNSPACRITNSDLGGNLFGLYAYGAPGPDGKGGGFNLITGNQFGNTGHDLALVDFGGGRGATDNVIAGNSFIPGPGRPPDTYDAIHIQDSSGNAVTGNVVIAGPAATRLWAGIHIYQTARGRGGANAVSGNVVNGPAGTGGAINVPPSTKLAGNVSMPTRRTSTRAAGPGAAGAARLSGAGRAGALRSARAPLRCRPPSHRGA